MEHPVIPAFIKKHRLTDNFLATALKWFIPIAEQLYRHQKRANLPFMVGLTGCQGSGKSTLTSFIKDYLTQKYGLNIAVLSLDDFYFTQKQRKHLATALHPLFVTRGVPGTHNLALLKSTLQRLMQNDLPLEIPRFNKATDEPFAQQDWPLVTEKLDMVIFEGWCWGISAQNEEQLAQPVNTLEASEDPDGIWRRAVNQTLRQDYQPLYELMNYWIQLKAPSFDCVYQWRKEQEQKLLALHADDAKLIMNDLQLSWFIQHYQRLTEHSLTQNKQAFDLTLVLNQDREIIEKSSTKNI